MNNYKDPAVVFQDQSSGIDLEICKIQHKLADNVAWLQKAFGRAIVQTSLLNVPQQGANIKNPTDQSRLKPLQTIFPEGYTAEGEPFNLMPNDNLKSYCFFVVRDPTTYLTPDFTDPQQIASAPVSIIFWANVQKTRGNFDPRINETYKADIIKILGTCPKFALKQSFEAYNTVFDLFTISETYRTYMRKPYIAFRFDGTISFAVFPENVCP